MVCPANLRVQTQSVASQPEAIRHSETRQSVLKHDQTRRAQASGGVSTLRPSHLEFRPGEAYRMLRPEVARISRNLLGSAPPSDLVHDICVDVALSLARYRGDCAFPSWVYEVVSRRVHGWLRKETRYKNLLREAQCCFKPDGPLWPDEASMDLGPFDLVRNALQALPERERTCLTLVRFEFRSVQEVAKSLCITPDAVRMSVHRARVHMRRALSEVYSSDE